MSVTYNSHHLIYNLIEQKLRDLNYKSTDVITGSDVNQTDAAIT